MSELPGLTPEERDALEAEYDEWIRSAEDQPPIRQPERWNHPIGLDDDGRKFTWDESPRGEDDENPAGPSAHNGSSDS
jgi:hypothetical protein